MPQQSREAVQNALVEEYREYAERLVQGLIRHLGLPTCDYEDMVAAGYVGLVEAARRYTASHERAAQFRSFAYLRIRGAVIDWIRESSHLTGRAYHVARALQASNDFAESEAQARAESPLGDNSLFQESNELANLLDATAGHLLIYRLSLNDAKQEVESIASEEESCEDSMIRGSEAQSLWELVATLPDKEREIIECYYKKGMSFGEIIDSSDGLSKSWVSRLHSRGLKLLRQKLIAVE